MTFYFRVDSGEAIGSGHVMRCLTLADRIKQTYLNRKIFFLSKPHHKNIIEIIKQRGFSVIELSKPEYIGNNDEKSWLGTTSNYDANEVAHILKNDVNTEKTLIIDHYAIDISWETIVRPYVKKIIVIDDLANRKHDCDVLLDQNFYLDKDTRYKKLVPEHTKLFLGAEYALLRPEFYEYAKNYVFSPDIKNIFVFFGGIDSAGMTLKTIKILRNYPDIHTHVVVSEHCADWQEISQISSETPYFTLYSYVDNMAKLMASCDIAIGAGGTTQWERACIGIPSIVTSIANNQVKACQDLSLKKYIEYADKDNLAYSIDNFIKNIDLRKEIYNKNNGLYFNIYLDYIT